ncbi:hypothetical protein [Spirillospora sp. NPDC047279]|uniref:hypothetical protein n=1 Tax=Spirillospora sp. NPDC047279 TaxID=3155478 RepID=UPI0033DE1409
MSDWPESGYGRPRPDLEALLVHAEDLLVLAERGEWGDDYAMALVVFRLDRTILALVLSDNERQAGETLIAALRNVTAACLGAGEPPSQAVAATLTALQDLLPAYLPEETKGVL